MAMDRLSLHQPHYDIRKCVDIPENIALVFKYVFDMQGKVKYLCLKCLTRI